MGTPLPVPFPEKPFLGVSRKLIGLGVPLWPWLLPSCWAWFVTACGTYMCVHSYDPATPGGGGREGETECVGLSPMMGKVAGLLGTHWRQRHGQPGPGSAGQPPTARPQSSRSQKTSPLGGKPGTMPQWGLLVPRTHPRHKETTSISRSQELGSLPGRPGHGVPEKRGCQVCTAPLDRNIISDKYITCVCIYERPLLSWLRMTPSLKD